MKDETDFGPMRLAGMALGEMFKDLRANILNSVDAIVFLGQTLQQALMQTMRNTLAQTAAFLGKKAALKGMEEEAEALSSLAAWDLAGFARHQAAAVGWFALAAAAAIGGQLISGSRSSAASSGGAGGSTSGTSQTQPTPNNQTYLYNQQATPSGSAAHLGDNGVGAIVNRLESLERAVIESGERHTRLIVTATERNTQALSMYETASFDDLLVKSARGNTGQRAIGTATHNFINDNFSIRRSIALIASGMGPDRP